MIGVLWKCRYFFALHLMSKFIYLIPSDNSKSLGVVEIKGGDKYEWNHKQWSNDFWNEENAYHFCLQESTKKISTVLIIQTVKSSLIKYLAGVNTQQIIVNQGYFLGKQVAVRNRNDIKS